MGAFRKLLGVFIAVAFLTAFGTPAKADNVLLRKTTFTFSAPIELPGMALPAGTYVFRLADTTSNHYVVQVFDKNEKHVYATLLAIPDYRVEGSDKTIVRFSEETPVGGVSAVKEWFYPGSKYEYGLAFIQRHRD